MTTADLPDLEQQLAGLTARMADALPAELTCTTIDVRHYRDGTRPAVAFMSPSFPGLAVTSGAGHINGVVWWTVTLVSSGHSIPSHGSNLDGVLAFAVALGRIIDWTTVTPDNCNAKLAGVVDRIKEARTAASDLFGEYSCEECEARIWLGEDD
jgi:hypothetical protein